MASGGANFRNHADQRSGERYSVRITAGTYQGMVRITPSGPTGTRIRCSGHVDGKRESDADVSPAAVELRVPGGNTPPTASDDHDFHSTVLSIPFTLLPTTDNGGNWLVLNSFSGQAIQGQPQSITVNAATSGLLPGNYTGHIRCLRVGRSESVILDSGKSVGEYKSAADRRRSARGFQLSDRGRGPSGSERDRNSSSTAISYSAGATTRAEATGCWWVRRVPLRRSH